MGRFVYHGDKFSAGGGSRLAVINRFGIAGGMENAILSEASCFDKLLGLKFTTDLKWNFYIESVAKETAKMVGSLHRSKRYLTPPAILYLYKT